MKVCICGQVVCRKSLADAFKNATFSNLIFLKKQNKTTNTSTSVLIHLKITTDIVLACIPIYWGVRERFANVLEALRAV